MRNRLELEELAIIYSICQLLGLETREQKIVCPLPFHLHHSNTPSFSIKFGDDGKEVFRCHGNCGCYGDVIDLVGYINIAGYNRKNPQHLARAVEILVSDGIPRVSAPVILQRPDGLDQSILERHPIGDMGMAYARGRGISDDVIREFRLGQKGEALLIPAIEEGVVKCVKYRNMGHQPLARYWSEKGSKMALFNYDRVAGTEQPVIVAKGEIAVMVLASRGFLACCTTIGEAAEFPSRYVEALIWSEHIIVIGDNDSPDIQAKLHPKNIAKADQLKAELIYPPAAYKDVDEWLIKDPWAEGWLRSKCT